MGAFYGTILVRTENSGAVRKALEKISKERACKFWMGPCLNGWISIFPSDDGQSEPVSAAVAARLPDSILHLTVHDDDIFSYHFYREGKQVDHYNSNPGYFDEDVDAEECAGKPELLQEFLPDQNALKQLKSLLAADHEKYTFESGRMAQFVELLELANALGSYDHLQGGERAGIESWDRFVHIEVQKDPAEIAVKNGQERYHAGQLDEALQDFEKAIALNPQLAAAYNGRGHVKNSKGDLAGALADYSRAIELQPDYTVAWNNRGLVKLHQRDFAGALADYNRAIEIKPDMVEAHNNRGDLKRIQGDWQGALADYDRAIELKPDLATAYNNRSVLKRDRGDLDGSLADCNRALKLDPDHAAAHSNRGLLRQAKGDLNGALADHSRAIELNPKSAEAYNNRAVVKHLKGDSTGALPDFDRAIELKPGNTQFHDNRANARRVAGDLDGALADANRAVELKPDYMSAYNTRGSVKHSKGDFTGAMADYNRVIELAPKYPFAYNNRGFVRQAAGDLDGALTDFDRAIELNPKIARFFQNRGRVKELKGDAAGAQADLAVAMALSPATVRKKIPATENALVLRTDFSDEAAWKSLSAAIQEPDEEFGFTANVSCLSDRAYEGVTAKELASLVAKGAHTFAFIVDRQALTNPEHPVLVVDLAGQPGRTFRVIPAQMWSVENNLSIANMGFEEFMESAGADGIFRGLEG